MRPLLLLLLAACGPAVVEAPAVDTGVTERRCGRPRCSTVRETCAGPQGQVCLCTTITCVDRCQTTVVGGEPECWVPRPLEVPRG